MSVVNVRIRCCLHTLFSNSNSTSIYMTAWKDLTDRKCQSYHDGTWDYRRQEELLRREKRPKVKSVSDLKNKPKILSWELQICCIKTENRKNTPKTAFKCPKVYSMWNRDRKLKTSLWSGSSLTPLSLGTQDGCDNDSLFFLVNLILSQAIYRHKTPFFILAWAEKKEGESERAL